MAPPRYLYPSRKRAMAILRIPEKEKEFLQNHVAGMRLALQGTSSALFYACMPSDPQGPIWKTCRYLSSEDIQPPGPFSSSLTSSPVI